MPTLRAVIIDVHTHAFPDHLAPRAMAQLQAETDEVLAVLDGTVADLLRSMDRSRIDCSVVASIATKPAQFEPILQWSAAIRSERILPFPSLHPDDPAAPDRAAQVRAAGFLGIKLHPYYQGFAVDDARMDAIYAVAESCGLAILMHAGFDIAFPRERVADPVRIRRVTERFPKLKFIAAHLGGWQDWDEVERHLLGAPVYLDLSTSLEFMEPVQAARILKGHRPDRLLFGTDSPWMDQQKTLELVRAVGLPAEVERRVLGDNAAELLGLTRA